MSPDSKKLGKAKKVIKQKNHSDSRPTKDPSEVVYQGKFFAFSVFLAGLAALYYWYCYGYHWGPNGDRPIFSVVNIEGKGKGLVAERNIKRGELVLREKPLFVVPQTVDSSTFAQALIQSELQQLSPDEMQSFLNLSHVNLAASSHSGLEKIALAIFQTNAVSIGGNVGIFPLMARLNHGCAASFNVVYNWREEEKHLVVHALKDIRKGQELLTAYFDTKRPRDERRAYLSQQYGFHCSCDVCSLPDDLSRISDERLSKISELYRKFSLWGKHEIDGTQAIDFIREIWQLEDEEEYVSERGQLAADATWIAASHSDAMAVQEWGRLAVEWFSYEIGADSIQVGEMEKTVAHPRTHTAWGTRSNYGLK